MSQVYSVPPNLTREAGVGRSADAVVVSEVQLALNGWANSMAAVDLVPVTYARLHAITRHAAQFTWQAQEHIIKFFKFFVLEAVRGSLCESRSWRT